MKPPNWRECLRRLNVKDKVVIVMLCLLGYLSVKLYQLAARPCLRDVPSVMRVSGPAAQLGEAALVADSQSRKHGLKGQQVNAITQEQGCVWRHAPPSQQIAASLPPLWRNHHIFASSLLDKCPDSMIPGSWMSNASTTLQSSMLPFTAQVQQLIWQHQHPKDCSKTKFLLYKSGVSGIGSVLHQETVALQAALDIGRVLVEHTGHFLTTGTYCSGNNTLDSCFFEPLSNCKLSEEDIRGAMQAQSLEDLQHAAQRVVTLNTVQAIMSLRGQAPGVLTPWLASTAIQPRNYYYWWRAQGVAYLVRPNRRTKDELQRRQRLHFRSEALAPGCISLYICHGDKGVEAEVFSDIQYAVVAELLRETDVALTNQLFLSTEDPATVEALTSNSSTALGYKWRTSYVDMPRKPDKQKSNLQYMAERGYAEEMLDGLLNLGLALQCDGFVASIYSNWARLIDELRSTVRCKASAVYMDAKYTAPADMDFNW